MRIWFAKDRGIVKEEFVLQGGEKVLLELAKFEPGELPPPAQPTPVPAVPAGLSRNRAVYYPFNESSFR